MIIIEGPDLAGKSTLCEALFKRAQTHSAFDPMVRHFTKVSPRFNKFWGYKSCIQRDVILDRFHMSHVVYRHMQNAAHKLTPFRYTLIDAEIARVGGVVVVLSPSPDLIASRFATKNRDEMYGLDQNLIVADIFRKLCENHRITTACGDYFPVVDLHIKFYGDLNLESVVDQILDVWEARQKELDLILCERPGTL